MNKGANTVPWIVLPAVNGAPHTFGWLLVFVRAPGDVTALKRYSAS